MTVDQAVLKLRELNWAAEEGWPYGYDADEVCGQAVEAMHALEQHVAAAPVGEESERWRQILGRIESKTYTATVQPKKRSA